MQLSVRLEGGKVILNFVFLFLSTIGFFFYFDMGVMAGALAVWFLFGGNSILYAGPVGGN